MWEKPEAFALVTSGHLLGFNFPAVRRDPSGKIHFLKGVVGKEDGSSILLMLISGERIWVVPGQPFLLAHIWPSLPLLDTDP